MRKTGEIKLLRIKTHYVETNINMQSAENG